MGKLFESIRRFDGNLSQIIKRSYGVIEIRNGQLHAIHFRPWPKIISTIEVYWLGNWTHRRLKSDRCLLYFNQPQGHREFLTLKYIVTSKSTSYRSFYQATVILDQIARIKNSDAIVTDVINRRISDRLLQRLGWTKHCLKRPGRPYIKRFYGQYPDNTWNPDEELTIANRCTNRD